MRKKSLPSGQQPVALYRACRHRLSRPQAKVRNTGVSTVMSNQLILSVQQPYQVAPAAEVPDGHSHLDFKIHGVLHEGVESSAPFAEHRPKVHPTHTIDRAADYLQQMERWGEQTMGATNGLRRTVSMPSNCQVTLFSP